MKVAVIGSRDCKDFTIEKLIEHLPDNCSLIISGGARGIDTLAEEAALLKQIPFIKHLPEYDKYGKKAPLLRNIRIISEAELVLAFWDFKSRGTAYVISQCVYRQIPVKVIGLED